MPVNGNIRLANKDAAWFTANATLVLLKGQHVDLLGTGLYKLGDGVTELQNLPFLGNMTLIQDGLQSGGNIIVVGNDIGISPASWLISPNIYATTINTDFLNITLSSAGNQRYIGFYGDNTNTITKVEGIEAAIASYPTTPLGSIVIGYVLVGDANISVMPDLTGYEQKINKVNTIFGNETDNTKYPNVPALLAFLQANYNLTLSEVLANGNVILNGQSFKSENGLMNFAINDNSIYGDTDNGNGFESFINIRSDGVQLYGYNGSNGFDSGASKTTVNHNILNEFNAPIHKFINGDILIENWPGRKIYQESDGSTVAVNFVDGTDLSLYWTDNTYTTSITINNTNQTIINSNVSGYKGLVYANDYSANFGNRSLIDKGYLIGLGYLTTSSAASTYLPLSGGTETGNILFTSNLGIDTTSTVGSDVLNIGATNANVINYGNASTIHNFLGTAIYELQVNAYVEDKLMTLNYNGAVSSGIGVGYEIEENGVITGYQKTNAARSGWSFKAPANTDYTDLVFTATSARTKTFQDTTSTIAEYGNKLSVFAATTSAELASVISDETGSGALVFANNPTLTSPIVGTQSANDNSTKAASTAYVDTAISSISVRRIHNYQNTDSTTTGSINETVLANLKVTGGVMGTNGVLSIDAFLIKTGTAASITWKFYVSTASTNTIGNTGVPTSSTLIGSVTQTSGSLTGGRFTRKMVNKNSASTQYVIPNTLNVLSDYNSSALARTSVNINTNNDFYVVVTATLGNSNDTANLSDIQLNIDKP